MVCDSKGQNFFMRKFVKFKAATFFRLGLSLICSTFFPCKLALADNSQYADLETRLGRTRLERISQETQWRKLLHYARFFPWNSTRGEVDGEGFYLSEAGRDDPLAELEATIAALESNALVGKLKQPATCAFPERLRYISSQLSLSLPAKTSPCPAYEDFIQKLHPKAVSLVFSSAFASNPGSMFGHTLLKIETHRGSDLLDYGISFAATVPPGEGGLLYVVLGLMGGYAGQYSFSPYYNKVQEYVNTESRDLWEYRLDLTEEESRRLVDHLWELESNSWFHYYFINKNCSYQLLTALEAVRPDWDIASGWFFVVPAETVKKIAKMDNSIKEIRFRSSLRSKMLVALASLSEEDRLILDRLIAGDVQPNDVQSTPVLAATIQFIQYHRSEGTGPDKSQMMALWRKTLNRMSQLNSGTDIAIDSKSGSSATGYQTPPIDHPEFAHGPIRVGLAPGIAWASTRFSQPFLELHIKPAYHDLMNDDRGYLPYSEIDFPNLSLRYYPKGNGIGLENIQFVGMTSLFPINPFEKRWSWKVDVELETLKDLMCLDCHAFHAEMDWGGSKNLGSSHSIAYVLGGGYLDIGGAFTHDLRGGPSLDAGVLINPILPYKFRWRARAYVDALQSTRPLAFGTIELNQSYSWLPHWEVRVDGTRVFHIGHTPDTLIPFNEVKGTLHYYF